MGMAEQTRQALDFCGRRRETSVRDGHQPVLFRNLMISATKVLPNCGDRCGCPAELSTLGLRPLNLTEEDCHQIPCSSNPFRRPHRGNRVRPSHPTDWALGLCLESHRDPGRSNQSTYSGQRQDAVRLANPVWIAGRPCDVFAKIPLSDKPGVS